jgi:hypothetical protein
MKCIIWDETLSSGANVIIWDYMLSSGMKLCHVELMLSSGADVIIWDKMLFGANVKIVSSGGNVIICCYHVMLSAGMITYPFFIFPENFTHSWKKRLCNFYCCQLWALNLFVNIIKMLTVYKWCQLLHIKSRFEYWTQMFLVWYC